jgi:hypothetical protein
MPSEVHTLEELAAILLNLDPAPAPVLEQSQHNHAIFPVH